MVCHRRAGKTVACVYDLIVRALRSTKPRPKFAYVGPFRQQAKETAWEYLKAGTENIRVGPPRESDLKITLPNDATIQIYGADNADALRGLYFDGIVLDEYGDYRPTIWGEIILPTLMDRRGWAVFIGTIKGKNHFYKTLERAKEEVNWFYFCLKASESGILSQEDLAEARSEMSEPQYEQEMECNPNAKVLGTYYSELISKAEAKGMIGEFGRTEGQVHVSVDLGFTDSTAFWFWQLDEKGPILIDYYEADSQPLEHYFQMLDEKGYDYADIWLPHDAQAKTLQTGRSTIEQFLQRGYPCRPVPKLSTQHGIDAARMILPKCRFNEDTCYMGIEALRAYRRQYNEKTQQFSNAPLHDWASNGADAFRYFALVTDTDYVPVEEEDEIQETGYTLNDLFAERENNWRQNVIRL